MECKLTIIDKSSFKSNMGQFFGGAIGMYNNYKNMGIINIINSDFTRNNDGAVYATYCNQSNIINSTFVNNTGPFRFKANVLV